MSDESMAIERCKHMVGLDRKKPYHRHGKTFYKPYRNYYEAHSEGDEYLNMLPSEYITREVCVRVYDQEIFIWYSLTRKGLDWLGRMLNMTIYDEEE